jgi:putative transposase
LELPRSTYYYVIKSLNKPDSDEELKNIITAIFNDNHKRYGYRRVTLELNKDCEQKLTIKKLKEL